MPILMPAARVAAVALALVAAGCMSVPASSVRALSQVDPLALEAGQLRAAFVHAPALTVLGRPATLTLTLTRDGEVKRQEVFALDVTSDGAGAPGVTVNGSQVLTVFAVATADRARFDAFQAEMRALRDAKVGGNTLALSLQAEPCVRGDGDASSSRVATYVRPKDRFVLLVPDLNLAREEPLPACETSPRA